MHGPRREEKQTAMNQIISYSNFWNYIDLPVKSYVILFYCQKAQSKENKFSYNKKAQTKKKKSKYTKKKHQYI